MIVNQNQAILRLSSNKRLPDQETNEISRRPVQTVTELASARSNPKPRGPLAQRGVARFSAVPSRGFSGSSSSSSSSQSAPPRAPSTARLFARGPRQCAKQPALFVHEQREIWGSKPKTTFAVLQRPTIERPVDGSWRVLIRCRWSAPTCPGRSVKNRIVFCVCVCSRTPALAVWCVHEQRPTGEIRLPDRPTERPGYAQITEQQSSGNRVGYDDAKSERYET